MTNMTIQDYIAAYCYTYITITDYIVFLYLCYREVEKQGSRPILSSEKFFQSNDKQMNMNKIWIKTRNELDWNRIISFQSQNSQAQSPQLYNSSESSIKCVKLNLNFYLIVSLWFMYWH